MHFDKAQWRCRWLGIVVAILVTIFLTACLEEPSSSLGPGLDLPTITSLTVEPEMGSLPETVQVRWTVENISGQQCLLELTRPGGDKDIIGGIECTEGRQDVTVVQPGSFQARLVVLDVDQQTILTELSVAAVVVGPTIASLTADPEEGMTPVDVQVRWTVENADSLPCLLELNWPNGDSEVVGGIVCAQGEYAANLVEPGVFQATLFVLNVDGDDSLIQQSVSAMALQDPAQVMDAMSDWILVKTDTNPYDLSVEADMFTENASYAGSFKECDVAEQSITHWYVVRYRDEDLANVIFNYTFDAPPPSAKAGEVITLTHALSVAGEVKAGGGHTPSGRAGYSSDIATPKVLSVSGAGLNDPRYASTDSGVVQLLFPTSGNWFGIEAQVLDANLPDVACDITWWYERYLAVQE